MTISVLLASICYTTWGILERKFSYWLHASILPHQSRCTYQSLTSLLWGYEVSFWLNLRSTPWEYYMSDTVNLIRNSLWDYRPWRKYSLLLFYQMACSQIAFLICMFVPTNQCCFQHRSVELFFFLNDKVNSQTCNWSKWGKRVTTNRHKHTHRNTYTYKWWSKDK